MWEGTRASWLAVGHTFGRQTRENTRVGRQVLISGSGRDRLALTDTTTTSNDWGRRRR